MLLNILFNNNDFREFCVPSSLWMVLITYKSNNISSSSNNNYLISSPRTMYKCSPLSTNPPEAFISASPTMLHPVPAVMTAVASVWTALPVKWRIRISTTIPYFRWPLLKMNLSIWWSRPLIWVCPQPRHLQDITMYRWIPQEFHPWMSAALSMRWIRATITSCTMFKIIKILFCWWRSVCGIYKASWEPEIKLRPIVFVWKLPNSSFYIPTLIFNIDKSKN